MFMQLSQRSTMELLMQIKPKLKFRRQQWHMFQEAYKGHRTAQNRLNFQAVVPSSAEVPAGHYHPHSRHHVNRPPARY